MIDRLYKQSYTNIFREILCEGTPGCYDEAALPSYTHTNKVMAWLFWQRIKAALQMAGDIKDQSVLDFGCGSGITFLYLHKSGCHITGCDSQFHQMAENICQKLHIQADIYRNLFEIDSRRFDCIIALDVLEHIEDMDGYIEKLKQLSHDKTKIILSGPTENMLYKTGRKLAGFSGDYHVRNIYDIERDFKKYNLQRTALKCLYFPFTLFRISSWRKKRS